MGRRTVSSGTEWEPRVGYSRAVRVGDRIHVSGTTATDDAGEVVAVGDPHGQARRAMGNVVAAVEAAGGSVEDVVRTRMYVVDIDDWEAVGRAHAAMFGDVRPATTMVEVSRLVDPDLLVEVEAEAVVGSGRDAGAGEDARADEPVDEPKNGRGGTDEATGDGTGGDA
jgi:enamine deaminase RidA (YjgF/YER057c/UK114 family)